MKNIYLVISLVFFSSANEASWITSLAKIGKGAEHAAAASKAATGAKGAAAAGIAVSELDDAAKAAKLNLAHPSLSEYETALIFNSQYPWAATRLAACILKNKTLTSNTPLGHCISQYQKCVDEKKFKNLTNTPNEVCITQTNKEY